MSPITKTIRVDLFLILMTLIDYCVIARNIKFGLNPSIGTGSSSTNLYRFILGQESTLEKRVPADVEVHLSCRFTKPVWYRYDKELSHNRSLIIRNISPKDSGRYACYTPVEFHGLIWSNLTLVVEPNIREAGERITTTISSKDDIADFKIVEDPSFKALLENDEDIVLDISNVQESGYQSSSETSSLPTTAFVQLPDTIKSDEKKAPSFWRSDKLQRLVQKTAGDTLQLSCPGHGNPIPNITWFLNDVDVRNALKQRVKLKKWSLSVEELQVSDAGLYKCLLCNSVGCIEHFSKVNVLEHMRSVPIIVPGTPHNLTVVVNETAKFECRIISDLEPFIVWIRHRLQTQAGVKELEQILPSITDFNSFSADYYRLPTDPDEPHVLHLQHVRPQQEGWYSCIAANSLGRSMASAYLSVIDPAGTDEATANAGQSKSQPFKVSPKLKLTTLELTDEVRILSAESDHNDIDYDAKDGDFDAKDTDADIKDSDTNFSEESPPKFKKSDKLINFLHKPAGSSIQLICPAVGNPLPNITWTRNSTEITRHIGKVTYKKWSILMDDVITEDSGAYTCTLCNKLGCISHTTKLTIIDRLRSRPIHSDKFPQNQTVLTNGSTVFECKVVSDVAPHFMWIRYTRNNETIKELEKSVPALSQDIGSKYAKDFVKLDTDPDEPHVLRLENVTHADEGWYTCVAASNLGQSMASAYLKVVDKLPTREVQPLLRSHPIWITVVVIVVVLLFLMGAIFIIYVLRKLKHEKLLKHRIETVHQWTKKVIIYKPPSSQGSSCDLQMPVIKIEKQRTTFQTSSNSDPTQAFNEYEFPLDSNWEIPRSHLTLGSTLGEGAFGRVVMAEATGLPQAEFGNSIVAVKMVKEEHTDADMASLVREMEVMKMIGKHINIINLLGCCTQNGPLWVIVEYAPHGNLKDFLKKNRPLSIGSPRSLQRKSEYLEEEKSPQLTEKHLISFAFQIARGMEYLASRRCIHRDLAARNVLVSDDYVIKIADFGLARDIQDTDYYRKNTNGRLPIKWMAPESLQEKFYDSQSDVWSYGVLLWEIMTYGEQPYPNIMSAEELYSYLITGQRMEKPARCSLNIYMLMRQCWHFDSSARPTFAEIVENLDKILQLAANSSPNDEYLDLSMAMLETPPSSSDEESETETLQESSQLRYQYTYKFK